MPPSVTASCNTPGEVLPSGAQPPDVLSPGGLPPTFPRLQSRDLLFVGLGGPLALEGCLSASFLTSVAASERDPCRARSRLAASGLCSCWAGLGSTSERAGSSDLLFC